MIRLFFVRMFPCRIIGWASVAAQCLMPGRAAACEIPVFRYALERWAPDPYVLVVFHRGTLSPEQAAAVDSFKLAAKSPNLLVRTADLDQSLSAAAQDLWREQGNPSLPAMVVRYPPGTGITLPLWAGEVQAEPQIHLSDSPVRREIARRLQAGTSAVWLLLESGDKTEDDNAARALESESLRLERKLVLRKPAANDPPLELDLPLRVAFSTVRLSRSDPAEKMLIAQLLNWDLSLKKIQRTLVFPVYGRGRVLPPIPGDSVDSGGLQTVARMLTGPCSCQIKEMNAGFDLLIASQWDSRDDSTNSASRATLPDSAKLTGLSAFAHAAVPTSQVLLPGGALDRLSQTQQTPNVSPKPGGHLARNLAILLASAVLCVAGGTLLMTQKGRLRTRD